ncbi:MAG: N-acyl homoserine lactonase family protein [Hansschlegelia sp.]
MNRRHAIAGLTGVAAGAALIAPRLAHAASDGMDPAKASPVERIYVLYSGEARVDDRSIYSPGVHVGEPVGLSCNAYLIKRADGWTLWDTGMEDGLAELPEGRIIAHDIRGIAKRTIAGQLKEIGIGPKNIGTLILSHAHFDHAGNCRLFPQARWIVQKAERDAMFGDKPDRFGFLPHLYDTLRSNPTTVVEGDHDVFGDGSVRMISTPGHTPGHCSLLVRLPKAGPVILSGDVAHFEESFRHHYVPKFNSDPVLSQSSMEKVEALMRAEGAKLWINHDAAQTASLPRAPQWIE